MGPSTTEVAQLLDRWRQGQDGALDRLIEATYEELCHMAFLRLRSWRSGPPIEATDLVHELYLRLAGLGTDAPSGAAQFFAFCGKAMRSILVDSSRRRRSTKRGGHLVRVSLTEDAASTDGDVVELLALDRAMDALAIRSPRMARIVTCRFLIGLSVRETARAVGASGRTVEREWSRARTFLQCQLV